MITPNGPKAFPNAHFYSGGGIDSDHFLANDYQASPTAEATLLEPKVLTISTGTLVTVPTIGAFVGSLPGGLDPVPGN